MRKFKVITSSVGGLNNKIYEGGETVQEDNFPQGNADELVSQGYLFEIKEPDPIVETEEEKKKREAAEQFALKEQTDADAKAEEERLAAEAKTKEDEKAKTGKGAKKS